jgi:hypothetical protein
MFSAKLPPEADVGINLKQQEDKKMPVFTGTIRYNPLAPNQTSSFLVENGGFQSSLIRTGMNRAQTANQLFFGLHKGNGAPLQVTGTRTQSPSGAPTIVFTSAS